jgi:hypothetical protein
MRAAATINDIRDRRAAMPGGTAEESLQSLVPLSCLLCGSSAVEWMGEKFFKASCSLYQHWG